jgi:hypothetical protein
MMMIMRLKLRGKVQLTKKTSQRRSLTTRISLGEKGHKRKYRENQRRRRTTPK